MARFIMAHFHPKLSHLKNHLKNRGIGLVKIKIKIKTVLGVSDAGWIYSVKILQGIVIDDCFFHFYSKT